MGIVGTYGEIAYFCRQKSAQRGCPSCVVNFNEDEKSNNELSADDDVSSRIRSERGRQVDNRRW